MKTLTVPSAILIDFAFVALAIVIQPFASQILVAPAYAQITGGVDGVGGVNDKLRDIADAIRRISACSR